MATSKPRRVVGWIITVLFGGLFIAVGLDKITGSANEMFAGWGYPAWFARLIGVLEMAGGIGLFVPKLLRWAVYGLTGVMIGAAYTHIASGEGLAVTRPIIFAAFLWIALWFRKGD